MFDITVKTYCGYTKTIRVIEPEFANAIVEDFMQAIDTETVMVVDGLTGEVLKEYRKINV